MAYDSFMFLVDPRQEAWHVDEGQYRDVECVAETDKTRSLNRRVNVQSARVDLRLVRNNSDRMAVEPAEGCKDILCPCGLYFEELPPINDSRQYFPHIVGLIRVLGQYAVEFLAPARSSSRLRHRRVFHIVGR